MIANKSPSEMPGGALLFSIAIPSAIARDRVSHAEEFLAFGNAESAAPKMKLSLGILSRWPTRLRARLFREDSQMPRCAKVDRLSGASRQHKFRPEASNSIKRAALSTRRVAVKRCL